MNLPELIDAIRIKYADSGIKVNLPASMDDIADAEARLHIRLPDDLRKFYLMCNGFACKDDLFNILDLKALFNDNEYGLGCVIFAERNVFSEVWAFRAEGNRYEIVFNDDDGNETVLTDSLTVFLERLLEGHTAGLRAWHEEMKRNSR